MTRLNILGACAALAVLAGGLTAAENPAIATLKKEVAALKAQEKATVQAIHAHYDAIIKRDKVTEEVLIKERHAVHLQEEQLLAMATTEEEKRLIRARYDEVRAILSTDIKMDAKTIERLREMRHAHIKQVEAAYRARIKNLEAELHALEHGGKPGKPAGTKPPKK
jgi:hypothetical protein